MHAGFLSLLFLPNLWYLYLPLSVLCFSLLILPPSSLQPGGPSKHQLWQ